MRYTPVFFFIVIFVYVGLVVASPIARNAERKEASSPLDGGRAPIQPFPRLIAHALWESARHEERGVRLQYEAKGTDAREARAAYAFHDARGTDAHEARGSDALEARGINPLEARGADAHEAYASYDDVRGIRIPHEVRAIRASYRRATNEQTQLTGVDTTLCPFFMSACPVWPFSALPKSLADWTQLNYECIEFETDARSCGGCASIDISHDCTAIAGAVTAACVSGGCHVQTCENGFSVSADAKSCVSAAN